MLGPDLTLVETLTGHDDRLLQAQALARDYADQQRAYHEGERETDPLPRRRPDQAGRRSDQQGDLQSHPSTDLLPEHVT